MRLIVDRRAIEDNIESAIALTNCGRISIVVKSFYDNIIGDWVSERAWRAFSLTPLKLCPSICYSIGDFQNGHKGAVITSVEQFLSAKHSNISEFYVPVNMLDNREGITPKEAKELIAKCTQEDRHLPWNHAVFILMVTSGCLNDRHPSLDEIAQLASDIPQASHVSVGGSFYLQFSRLPECIKEIRIGEYALFGTIPYCDQVEKFGRTAIKVEMDVIQTYPKRQHILIRGGYSEIDTKDCFLLTGGLEYVDSSSEYTIYRDRFRQFTTGDKVVVVPNYKSLVKLRHVPREFA